MSLIVIAQNISNLASESDYTYQVLVGDGGPRSRILATGTVKKHRRSDGWKALIRRILKEASE